MIIQLKKGILELLVLSSLKEKDMYGYELVEEISKYIDISEGTIYPLLRRINKEGYVNTYLLESSSGPPRKYYNLTETGHQAYKEKLNQWESFSNDINSMLRRD